MERVILMVAAGLSSVGEVATTAYSDAKGNSMTHEERSEKSIADMKQRLGVMAWNYCGATANKQETETIKFFDGQVTEVFLSKTSFGKYGERRTAYYYRDGEIIGFESRGRILSDNGAPSDGWYLSEVRILFEGDRFVAGSKTVNGKPSEPDEHEVRAAFYSKEKVRQQCGEG